MFRRTTTRNFFSAVRVASFTSLFFLEDLTSCVFYKFQRGLCNEFYYGECARHLNIRAVEHLVHALLTRNKVSLRTAP